MRRTLRVAGFPRLLLSVGLALAVLAGCAKPVTPPPTQPPTQTPPQPPTQTVPPNTERTVDWWFNQLTLEEKVGQLFWFGLKDATLSAETEQLIKEGKAGGFIFFARQGNDPVNLRQMTDRMQSFTFERGRPTPGLVISVDHEGGIVQRWLTPWTQWPGNMAIGATRNENYAASVAGAMAEELKAVGIQLNLSPVADVNINPANPVIGVRSFGEEPQAVSNLVGRAVQGTQQANVSATAKHFPGHGDTHIDSHKALPTVDQPIDRLEKVELAPFRSAIAAGVDVIMTAHIIFPAVEPDGLPATLSAKVISGLLKGKMGFKGVVTTDAIDTMKAISDNYGTEQAIVMAVQAGADAVLVTDSFGKQAALYNTLLQAVKDGKISQGRLDDAVRRQLTLKAKRGLLPAADAKPPVTPSADEIIKAVNNAQHRDIAAQAGRDALTLVRNKHLPLKLTAEQQVLVVGPSYGGAGSPMAENVYTALGYGIKQQHPNTREVVLDRKPTAAGIADVRKAAAGAQVIVYGVYNGHDYTDHQMLIKELIATGKPVIVVGLGDPYELTVMPQIQTYVAAYGYLMPNVQNVGALLFGKLAPKGKLPVRIPDLYPLGHGLSF